MELASNLVENLRTSVISNSVASTPKISKQSRSGTQTYAEKKLSNLISTNLY